MRAAMGSAKLAQLKDKADKHTLYIFGRGYTREKLPTWSTHPMARQQELEEAGGDQSQISSEAQRSVYKLLINFHI